MIPSKYNRQLSCAAIRLPIPMERAVAGRGGRTIHIPVMIGTFYSTDSMLTECARQLFLDQTLIKALTTSVSPCGSCGGQNTNRKEDSIYSSSTGLTLSNVTTCGGYS